MDKKPGLKDSEIINDIWTIIYNHAGEHETDPNTYAYYGIGAGDFKGLVEELRNYFIRESGK